MIYLIFQLKYNVEAKCVKKCLTQHRFYNAVEQKTNNGIIIHM